MAIGYVFAGAEGRGSISDSGDRQSLAAVFQVDVAGETHLAWQEETDQGAGAVYSWGRPGYWTVPALVSPPERAAYLPSLAVLLTDERYLAWDRRDEVMARRASHQSDWGTQVQLAANSLGVQEVILAAGPEGSLHAAWLERAENGDTLIRYSQRLPCTGCRHFLPLVTRNYSS